MRCMFCRHFECVANIFFAVGYCRCDECELVKEYEQAVNEYCQLMDAGKYAEADQVKKKIMPMVDEQLRVLRGGE